MEVNPTPVQRSLRTTTGRDDRRQLLRQHAELRIAGTHREPGVGLRHDARVDADEHFGPRRGCTPGKPSQRGRFLNTLERRPQQSCSGGEPQLAIALADAFEGDALRLQPGTPGERYLAGRDGVGAEAGRSNLGDEWRQRIRLERIEPQPWVGKCLADGRRGGA